jgi:hypothetical protein
MLHLYRKACRSRVIKVAVLPIDSLCDGPVTYPGVIKAFIKSSKRRSGHQDGSPTNRLALRRAGNLSRGHQSTHKILKRKKRTDTKYEDIITI